MLPRDQPPVEFPLELVGAHDELRVAPAIPVEFLDFGGRVDHLVRVPNAGRGYEPLLEGDDDLLAAEKGGFDYGPAICSGFDGGCPGSGRRCRIGLRIERLDGREEPSPHTSGNRSRSSQKSVSSLTVFGKSP